MSSQERKLWRKAMQSILEPMPWLIPSNKLLHVHIMDKEYRVVAT